MNEYQVLEESYAKWVGKDYGVAVNSGTAALHLSLLALGVGKGDEVIVPDFAFAAVAFAVTYCGATPVFVDCDENYNIDPEKIVITPKTKAIIAVHTYGRLCDMNRILAKAGKIPVIEDACEAQGADVGKGTIVVFSFYKNKVLPGEEGGMALLNDPEMYRRMHHLKNYAHQDKQYFHTELGFNYRMPDAEARLALKSFEDRKEILAKRRVIEQLYISALGGKAHDSPWVFDMETDLIENALDIHGTRCFFKPMSTFPIYNQTPCPNALRASKKGFVVNLDHTKPLSEHLETIQKIQLLAQEVTFR